MTSEPVAVSPNTTLTEFVEHAASNRRFSTYPVSDQGRLVGVVSLGAVAFGPHGRADPAPRRRGHDPPGGRAHGGGGPRGAADLFDEGDYARGRTVAATGTVQVDGDGGVVGGPVPG